MNASRIPDKPSLDGLEERWDAVWERDGIYRFDATAPRDEVFSIDNEKVFDVTVKRSQLERR